MPSNEQDETDWGPSQSKGSSSRYVKVLGGFVYKFVHDPNKTPDSSQRPPHDCPKCGNPVDGLYCRQCALLRKKLKEVWCGDSLDNIFCQQCTCESCGNGAHIGYNCPPKVLIISNPKPCYNQNVDEFLLLADVFIDDVGYKQSLLFVVDDIGSIIHQFRSVAPDHTRSIKPAADLDRLKMTDARSVTTDLLDRCYLDLYFLAQHTQQINIATSAEGIHRNTRYTWTHFLRSKDETPEVLIDFLRLVQRGLPAQGFFTKRQLLEHLNKTTNRTLVEAARTMLSVAKVPLFFWAEAIATTCFTQNRSLVIPRHEKKHYHIINDRKPSVKFFYIFGSLCYIVRDGENLDKMKEKDKIVRDPNKTPDSSQQPPHSCPKCGNLVDGLYCRQCAILRKKLKEVWFTICDEHKFFQDFLNTFELSNDDFNVVNAPQEPFIFNQDLDEFIKSSVENLVPNPSESEDLSKIGRECDVLVCDDFTTFSNLLFDADNNFSSTDNESFSDEDVLKEIYSNPLFDEEIISTKIDRHHFNVESDQY
nr:hypothetical protein [Tanacetum cinerariifolium]